MAAAAAATTRSPALVRVVDGALSRRVELKRAVVAAYRTRRSLTAERWRGRRRSGGVRLPSAAGTAAVVVVVVVERRRRQIPPRVSPLQTVGRVVGCRRPPVVRSSVRLSSADALAAPPPSPPLFTASGDRSERRRRRRATPSTDRRRSNVIFLSADFPVPVECALCFLSGARRRLYARRLAASRAVTMRARLLLRLVNVSSQKCERRAKKRPSTCSRECWRRSVSSNRRQLAKSKKSKKSRA